MDLDFGGAGGDGKGEVSDGGLGEVFNFALNGFVILHGGEFVREEGELGIVAEMEGWAGVVYFEEERVGNAGELEIELMRAEGEMAERERGPVGGEMGSEGELIVERIDFDAEEAVKGSG